MPETKIDRYPLGRSAGETERLMSAARMARVSIRRFLEDAGIRNGMKVLDVGCGAGDVSFMAAEMVGPSGSVVGIDLNATILETARRRAEESGASNVTFLAKRIPEELSGLNTDFDALIGRRVLCYIPAVAGALRALARHVREGGVVAFQEVDWTIWAQHSFPLSPYFDEVWKWIYAGFEAGGTDMAMGTKLHQTFVDAGLPGPTMRAEAGIGHAAAVLPPTLGLLRSLRETLLRQGIAKPEDLDSEIVSWRVNEEFAERQSVGCGGFEVSAWSSKPV